MLVHAAVLDDQRIAGFPWKRTAVMHVVALALQHEEHRAVHMAVLLAVAAGGKALHMGFDRLRNLRDLRIDDLLAVGGRAAFPLVILGGRRRAAG